MKRLIAVAALTCIIVAAYTLPSTAAAPAHSGLVVSPAIEQLTLARGQNSVSFNAQLTNDSPAPVTLAVQVDDFTALNTTGTPLFLNNTKRLASPHGLAHWMTPAVTGLTLTAEQTQTIPITLNQVASLAPGGHYGAVIFSVVPPTGPSVQNSVGAHASVSMLVFVTTSTPGRQVITLLPVSASPVLFGIPSSLALVFSNTGDVQTTPRGTVIITNRAGNQVAKGLINIDSGQILPQTERLYQVAMAREQSLIWPGIYRLEISYRPSGAATTLTFSQQFIFIPTVLAAIVGLALLLVGGFVLRRLLPSQFVGASRR